ncbi:MAG: aminoglycoside phosphotransferase family protein [Chloroflexi bacterium]|nr:aminoglycoside phosphotransferase family protein [Chloroflexota bacterium]MCI0576905.1 aminoglycoside phosphotransferase family protein [Chloroflexota bacterium]MCI0646441.1 aminoglycoside phosphotransferase family protein [Chloroflexota bacterium]MCI0731411.1 aminoglycoside phosphotransferase family protein [Chloroflexota bacterium]
MLEKPDLQDEKIVACLQDAYGLLVVQLAFLPLGADRNTAVYRALAEDETPYFVKLRRGLFNETAVALPKFLGDQGIRPIIAPLATKTEQLWATVGAFKLILYPFVEGHDAYEVALSDHHWRDLGVALKSIHTAVLPPALRRRIQQETYSPQWREMVKTFLERVEHGAFDDPVAVKLAAFLQARRQEILDLVGRAERLARPLQARSPEFVLCHSDIHAGNLLIDANDALYIVDWDDPILAFKERDLMFIGGGLVGAGHTPQEEETLFYESYGQTEIDPIALAYYRYERIIQDIAQFCDQILSTNEGGEDREQSLRYLMSNFLPNDVLEIAYKSDKTVNSP